MLPFPLRNRHFIVFLVLLVAITLGLNYFIRRTHVEMLRQELMNLSAIAALSVDGADLEQLLQGRQEDTPEYRQLAAKLEQVLRQNNRFTSIHLLRRTGDPSVYALIADADGKGDSAKPGEMYQAWLVPAMFEAFGGPSADKTLMTDQWGSFLSGYAPVYDEGGKAIAIIGVDYDANQVVADLNRYTYLIIIYMFITLASQ
jgi:hypothetical protein